MPAAGDQSLAQATPTPPGSGSYEALPEGAESLLSASVRLLATQMAILSRSRDEIALRLREEFGIDVPVGLEAPPERDEAYSS
jgi:hypothetical protein